MQRPNGLYQVNEGIPNAVLLQSGDLVQVDWLEEDVAWALTKDGVGGVC